MLDLTLEERLMIKAFIDTSLKNVTDTVLVDTFVLLLGGDDVIRKSIANQVAQYMQAQVDALNSAINNLDIDKNTRQVFLSSELTKFSDLKTKLDAV